MASILRARAPVPGAAQELEDLVRESLQALLPVTVALAWLWLVQAIIFARPYQLPAYIELALLGGAALASHRLQKRYLRLAVWVYLLGLTLMVIIIAITVPGLPPLYLFLLVVLIAAMLTNPAAMWAATVGAVFCLLIIGAGKPELSPSDLSWPVVFVVLTALTAWLSSRRLFTALDWALQMTREAERNAKDARERRAEVRSMLKSLDEAYARLERANEALLYAREAAEKAYRFKSEFVANVSHELRTPLNLIVGFSQMIATAPESYKGIALPNEYRGDVMAIYRSARHLSDLINDVLDLSQVEAGRLPLDRGLTDLGEVIHEAAEIVRGLGEAKGLRLDLDLPDALPPVRLDRTRIRQVLLNLLTNATRFTDEGWIRVCSEQVGDEIRVKVIDSGRGIAADRIDRAFEAFSQLHDGTAREGSGLGLAVSKKFVELHGGTMYLESSLGHGTTVVFTLPLPDRGREAPLTLLRSRAPASGSAGLPWVLVVHEDPHAVDLLRRYIDGYEFVRAESWDEATAIAREVPPAAIIADNAPGDGHAAIPAGGLPASVPILACPLPSLRRLGTLLGATDYLAKPVTREDVLAAVGRLAQPPRRVLVIDDDPSFVRLLTRMLKSHNGAISVLEASGGAEGLALARSQQPDLVLLDLLMPGMSGYDFLQQIAHDEALAGMPVVILSARAAELEATAIQGELRLAWVGGFSVTELLHTVQGVLGVITRPAGAAQPSA